MPGNVHNVKDSLQKIGEVWELLQAYRFDYEKSVDLVLESEEIQSQLRQASDAVIGF